jgi:hypothetical protein
MEIGEIILFAIALIAIAIYVAISLLAVRTMIICDAVSSGMEKTVKFYNIGKHPSPQNYKDCPETIFVRIENNVYKFWKKSIYVSKIILTFLFAPIGLLIFLTKEWIIVTYRNLKFKYS